MEKRIFDLEERLINYSIKILETSETIFTSAPGRHLGNQLIRSGTSPALVYAEALGAESRNDFIHKMKVSLKELRETNVCLKIIQRKPLVKDPENLNTLLKETSELISIFSKSISTAKQRKAGILSVKNSQAMPE